MVELLRSHIVSGDPQLKTYRELTLVELLKTHIEEERYRYVQATKKRWAASTALNRANDELNYWTASLKNLYNNGTIVYSLPHLRRFAKPEISKIEAVNVLTALGEAIKALETYPDAIQKADALDADLPDNAIDRPTSSNP